MTDEPPQVSPPPSTGARLIKDLAASFPGVDIDPSETLYRAHREDYGAVHYCTNKMCRFDPPAGARSGYGTCCTATLDVVALREHLGDLPLMTDEWVQRRAVSEIKTVRTVRIANLLDGFVAGRWHIGEDVQVGPDRTLTQAWGAAFRRAGFGGVRHKSRLAPSLNAICLAFFGPPRPAAGRGNLASGDPQPVSAKLLADLDQQCGVRVLPRTKLP